MDADHKDRMDCWLDSALKQYGDVEPRIGLERRIMANLEARTHSVARRYWLLALASIAVVCVSASAIWRMEIRQPLPSNISKLSPPSSIIEPNSETGSISLPQPRKHPARVAIRPRQHIEMHSAHSAHPQNFPSRSPLSERELALARYAATFPREAELIAEQQQIFEEEVQKAQLELRNQTELSDQER